MTPNMPPRAITATDSQNGKPVHQPTMMSPGNTKMIALSVPAAEAIGESMENARPRPLTPYYGEVSQSLQRTWHPPGQIDPATAPQEAADLIRGVLAKEDLL